MDLVTSTNVYREVSKRDDEVQQQLNKALAGRGSVPLRNVRADLHEGLVILRGTVCRYYDKQLAQEVVKQIDGVETINNEIVVQ